MRKATHITAALLLAAALSDGCVKEKKNEGPVTVVGKIGTVSLNAPGNELPINASLSAGDMILTGENSLVTLLFPEHSAVRVYETSVFTISKMGPAGTAAADDTEFAVEKGRALFIISKLAKPDSLRVTTPTAVASVRGTSFVVSVDERKESVAGPATGVTVLRGAVHVVVIKRPRVDCLVKEGEMLEVSDTTAPMEPTAIPKKALKELGEEEAALGKMSGRTEGTAPEVEKGAAETVKKAAEKPAPVLKTEKAIKEYYNKLEEVSLDDGTVLVGAVIYQNSSVARIHTPHGIIQVPTGSIKTIRMR